MITVRRIAILLNLLEVTGLAVILVVATGIQFFFHELPCPLCLLQRMGLLCVAFCLMLNLKYGPRPSHYGLALLSIVLTAAMSLRQILLHIVPGTGDYGPAILGLHMYTWVFVLAVALIIYLAIVLLLSDQFSLPSQERSKWLQHLITFVFFLIILVTFVNAVSVFLECGLSECPSDPASYKLLSTIVVT